MTIRLRTLGSRSCEVARLEEVLYVKRFAHDASVYMSDRHEIMIPYRGNKNSKCDHGLQNEGQPSGSAWIKSQFGQFADVCFLLSHRPAGDGKLRLLLVRALQNSSKSRSITR